MNVLKNAKVKTKLFFMLTSFFIFLAIIGATGYYYLQNSNAKINTIYKNKLLPVEYLGQAQAQYNSSNTDLFELMITKDINRNNELLKDRKTKKNALNTAIAEYGNTKLDSFEVDTLKQLTDNFATADSFIGNIESLTSANKNEEAYTEYNNNLNTVNLKIEKNLTDLINYNIKTSLELNQQNAADYNKARLIIIVIILMALIIETIISLE